MKKNDSLGGDQIEIREISYTQEILRKGIHMLSLSIPIIYYNIPQWMALSMIVPLAAALVFFDIMSKHNNYIRELLMKYFGKMLRPHETKLFVLNGASWVLISATICIIVFPKIIMITGFSVLIISDITAALIGRKYGKRKFLDKSLVGTSAFIISAFLVCSVIGVVSHQPLYYYPISNVAAFIGGITEAASKRIQMDDNLTIPVSIGLIMMLLYYVFNLSY
jgi:dolichol kinase